MKVEMPLDYDEALILTDALTAYVVRKKRDAKITEAVKDLLARLAMTRDDIRSLKEPRKYRVDYFVNETQYRRLSNLWEALEKEYPGLYQGPGDVLRLLLTVGSSHVIDERLDFWEKAYKPK